MANNSTVIFIFVLKVLVENKSEKYFDKIAFTCKTKPYYYKRLRGFLGSTFVKYPGSESTENKG